MYIFGGLKFTYISYIIILLYPYWGEKMDNIHVLAEDIINEIETEDFMYALRYFVRYKMCRLSEKMKRWFK